MWIPTFIADDEYAPARTLPTFYFFNGRLETDPYIVDQWNIPSGTSITALTENFFPYFDHYEVVSGQTIPTTDSKSLLFFNEANPYGASPYQTLFSEYWDTYISLLYNPVTRLIEAEAVIPLADYFELELNDIVQWRGNHYHLRAINDYNLSTGECKIQLLGPIIEDSLDES